MYGLIRTTPARTPARSLETRAEKPPVCNMHGRMMVATEASSPRHSPDSTQWPLPERVWLSDHQQRFVSCIDNACTTHYSAVAISHTCTSIRHCVLIYNGKPTQGFCKPRHQQIDPSRIWQILHFTPAGQGGSRSSQRIVRTEHIQYGLRTTEYIYGSVVLPLTRYSGNSGDSASGSAMG